jgi:hypothetical protein
MNIQDIIKNMILLFLILYSSMIGPKLPDKIINILDNGLFKILAFTMIIYTFNQNNSEDKLLLSIVVAITFSITMYYITKNNIGNIEKFDNNYYLNDDK